MTVRNRRLTPSNPLPKPGVGVFYLGDTLAIGREAISGDYGGNIEVLPPNAVKPLGTLMLGNTASNGLKQFLQAQEYQWDGPSSAETPVKWLEVGHIDEVTSFLPGGRVLLADSRQAIELLESKFPAADQDARARAVFFARTGEATFPTTQIGQLTVDYDPNQPQVLFTGVDHRNGPQFKYIRFYTGKAKGYVAKVEMDNTFVRIVKESGDLAVWFTGADMAGYETFIRFGRMDGDIPTPDMPQANDKFVLVEDTLFWANPATPSKKPFLQSSQSKRSSMIRSFVRGTASTQKCSSTRSGSAFFWRRERLR